MLLEATLLLICCPLIILCEISDEKVDKYEELIKTQIKNSENYVLPQDLSKDKPPNEELIEDVGTFDFIIVGGGTTGCVLANRLSKITKWRILLLEAGNYGNNLTDIPSMDGLLKFSEYNWGYKSIKQKTACLAYPNQECPYDRGKGIGGSTLINGLVYSRGTRQDFDYWSSLGNPGWSYNELLPYFKLSENFRKNDENVTVDYEYHHSDGLLNVEYHQPRNYFTNIFIEANRELGYKSIDHNSGKPIIGVSATQVNTRRGRREHTGNAFIEPIKYKRDNLKITTSSYATALLFNGTRVVGVKFAHERKYYKAHAKFEVILSAGAFGSAQLLLLSGIGPARDLKKLNITLVKDLKVGEVLRDHPKFQLGFTTNYTDNNNETLRSYIKNYLHTGSGSLSDANALQALLFSKSKIPDRKSSALNPDLELLITPFYGFIRDIVSRLNTPVPKLQQFYDVTASFYISIVALHSKSRGNFKLKSSSAFDYPLINPRHLSDTKNYDISVMYEGIKTALQLSKTPQFKKINTTVTAPKLEKCKNTRYLSREYWYCVLRHLSENIYHPSGTCQMGPDPMRGAVVDAEARVHGVRGLRVADASVIPISLSGHLSAVCVMIGEKVSDLIKSRYL